MNKLPEEVKKIIELLEFGHTEKAIKEGIEAVKLYPENYYAVFFLGVAYRIQGNLKEALNWFKKAEKLAPNDLEIASVFNRIALTYENMGEINTALFYHNKDLELSIKNGNNQAIAAALNNIATIYSTLEDFEKAEYYLNEAMKYQINENDRATTLSNIAWLNYKKGKFDVAIKYLRETIEKAKDYNDYNSLAFRLYQLGQVYVATGEHNKAEESFFEASLYSVSIGNKFLTSQILIELGDLLFQIGEFERAKVIFDLSKELAKDIKNAELLYLSLLKIKMIENIRQDK